MYRRRKGLVEKETNDRRKKQLSLEGNKWRWRKIYERRKYKKKKKWKKKWMNERRQEEKMRLYERKKKVIGVKKKEICINK